MGVRSIRLLGKDVIVIKIRQNFWFSERDNISNYVKVITVVPAPYFLWFDGILEQTMNHIFDITGA